VDHLNQRGWSDRLVVAESNQQHEPGGYDNSTWTGLEQLASSSTKIRSPEHFAAMAVQIEALMQQNIELLL
jgi:hypothetical protein